jgi:hypothetical protein
MNQLSLVPLNLRLVMLNLNSVALTAAEEEAITKIDEEDDDM